MISIIIVNFNTGKFIFRCIDSISKFLLKDKEIVVVDNNSNDGSLEKLKIRKDIRLVENNENLGFAKAVNRGLQIAKGDFIFILNPDTELTKDSVGYLFEFARQNKEVGIVAPKLLNPDGSVQPSCYHDPTLLAAFREYFADIKGAFSKYAPPGSEPVKVDSVVGAAMFLSRRVIDKVGMFDERYFMYFEDLDYCRRIRNKGFNVYYLPRSKIYHEHGGVTRTVPESAKRWLIESSIVYHGKMGHNLLTLILWLGQKWSKLNESI